MNDGNADNLFGLFRPPESEENVIYYKEKIYHLRNRCLKKAYVITINRFLTRLFKKCISPAK